MSLLFDTLKAHAETRPDSLALIGSAGALSYGALLKAITEKAEFLKASDCHVIGLQMDNGPEWVLWDLAALKSGIVCVPLPSFFTSEQTRHVVRSTGAGHIVTEGGLISTGAAAVKTIPESTAKITFTSGTTGAPKGVCLPQAGMERTAQSIVEALGQDYAGKHLSVMPLPVLLENVAGVYAALLAGAECHLYSSRDIGMVNPFVPDFTRLMQTIRENAVSSAILVPELLRGLMQTLAQSGQSLPFLKFVAVGGSKIAPDLIEKARALGLPAYEGYGLSECGSVVSMNTPEHDRIGSAGRLLPHIRMQVKNGEIVIQNPAFLGYVGQPHTGDFATGDLGAIDADGFIQINGRKKNILITSHGRNVSPEWVESVLLARPEILQAVVFGDARPHLGAFVVSSCGYAQLSAAMDMANRSLPDYAQVKEFHIVKPFTVQDGTLTGTGRPRREKIFEQYRTLIKKDEEHGFLRSTG